LRHRQPVEAESHLREGLKGLQHLPESSERDNTELIILSTLGVALTIRLGWAAPAVADVYARAQILLDRVGRLPHLFWVLWGMWAYYLVKGDQLVALSLAQQMSKIAEQDSNEGQQVEAHFALGLSHHLMGDIRLADVHLKSAVAGYSSERHGTQAHLTGQDVGATARSQYAVVLQQLGATQQGLQVSRDAVAHGERIKHPFSQAYALGCSGMVYTPIEARGKILPVKHKQRLRLVLINHLDLGGWEQSSLRVH